MTAFSPPPLTQIILTPPAPTLRVSLSDTESVSNYQLKERDFELLKKFQSRTVFTISNPNNVDVYLDELVKLGCSVRPSLLEVFP